MKVLGFRSDPNASRYAILSEHDGTYTFENAASDNKLTVPASIAEDSEAERLGWIYSEILAIFDANQDITKVIIKQNEFTRQDTKAKRRSSHTDAAVLLACAHRNVPVEIKIYSSMGTTSTDTKRHAESRVGKSLKYWDAKMADAVNAAWWGHRHT